MVSLDLKKYEILMPTEIPGLYRSVDVVYHETEYLKSKTPEYIKEMLVKAGYYSPDIRVIHHLK